MLKYEWKLWYCGNCSTFVHVSHANVPDKLLVNAALLDSAAATAAAAADVSPVFGIVLRPSELMATVLLEAPDDPAQLEVYNRLQKLVVAKMKDAEDAMNKRIEHFVEQQREQLQELTTRAYQDKKLFWLRYTAAIKGGGPALPAPAAAPAAAPTAVLPHTSTSSSSASSPVIDPRSASSDSSPSASPLTRDAAATAAVTVTATASAAPSFAPQPTPAAAPPAADPSDSTSPAPAPKPAAVPRKASRVRVAGDPRPVFDIDIGASQDVVDDAASGSDVEDESSEEAVEPSRVQRRRADATAATQSPKPRAVAGVAMSMPLAIPDFGGRRRTTGAAKPAAAAAADDEDDASPLVADEQLMARTFQAPSRGHDEDGFDRPSFRDRAEYRARKFTK